MNDNLVVNLWSCIRTDINASTKSLFLLLGFPGEMRRPMVIALYKFLDRPLSHLWLQLGFFIDTHVMRVYLLEPKITGLLT